MGCDKGEIKDGNMQTYMLRNADIDANLSSSAIVSLHAAARHAIADSSNFIVALLCVDSLDDSRSESIILGRQSSTFTTIGSRRLSKAEKKKLKKQASLEPTTIETLEKPDAGCKNPNVWNTDDFQAIDKITGLEIVLQLASASQNYSGTRQSLGSAVKLGKGDETIGFLFLSSVESCESIHANLVEYLKVVKK